MRALSGWCVRHRWAVVTIWLVVLVVLIVSARSVGTDYSSNFSLPGTPSNSAYQLLKTASPSAAGDTEDIVFAAKSGARIDSPAIESRIVRTLELVAKVPDVATIDGHPRIVSPVAGGPFTVNPLQVSRDGRIAYATVGFSMLAMHISTPVSERFVTAATSLANAHLTVAVGGQVAEQSAHPAIGGMKAGAVAALIVLLLVFGSVAAALMPLASALVALGIATSIVSMLTHILQLPSFAPQLVILIGLGVGVDYALFIVSRHRQGLIEGLSPEDSIVQAVNTSGRAVLFAGIIVCVALLGMIALGVSFLYGLAISASIGVAFTMTAALTLLPALLGFIGPRILSRRQRRTLSTSGPRDRDAAGASFWDRWSRFVARRPIVPAVLALTLIGLLATPFFSMRLGSTDAGSDPKGTTTRVAYDLLAEGFGAGYNGPLEVVAAVPSAADQSIVAVRLRSAIAATPGVVAVSAPLEYPVTHDGHPTGRFVDALIAIPSSSPQAQATTNLVDRLRTAVVPAAISGTPVRVYVGGVTAAFIDLAHLLGQKLPLFIGVVVLVSFLLLAIVFRSLVVPLVSAAMNLLSIGSAFGILTAVFQWGWLGGLVGVSRTGPIESFLPVMMFAILFGLSMDYQVFLVTRMHEEWRRTGDNRTAVRLGIARTGKTITAAAAIMIVVFASFILGGQQIIREFGVGLAGGVLVDAVVIRMAVVPAVMLLCGRANWWFPGRLDRALPHAQIDVDE